MALYTVLLALVKLTLVAGGALILYTSQYNDMYYYKLERIQYYTAIPIATPLVSYIIYTCIGALYIASGILMMLYCRIGKTMGITASVLFCLLFDNPLTHLNEEGIFIFKVKMLIFHIVVIALISDMPMHPACKTKTQ